MNASLLMTLPEIVLAVGAIALMLVAAWVRQSVALIKKGVPFPSRAVFASVRAQLVSIGRIGNG